ncbi:hypothetical protein PIIN_06224 [Serendipita indica DSM 11827]|uniref:Uncharacterized protein n=1 Tax=Serendipita indica (strain DSM 11827) TaxID=1109443 RepID=G4TLU7_SERID|nr:hypothetical protein PIIN_06224 [Serendipita indica DSM 11827]
MQFDSGNRMTGYTLGADIRPNITKGEGLSEGRLHSDGFLDLSTSDQRTRPISTSSSTFPALPSMSATLPLKNARLVSLALAWCFGVIGGSVGINSIVKRNQQVADLKRLVAPIRLWVDTFDLINSGIVLAVGCGVLSVVCSIWIGLILLDSRKRTTEGTHISRAPLSTRLLKFEWISLAFMDIWILACAIPVTYIGRTGNAHVRAFLANNELAPSVVAATQSRLGVKSDYWHNYSVKLQVIPPWFTLLFGVIAAAISFTAARKAHTISDRYNTGESPITGDSPTTADEKAVEHHDHAESGRPADSPIDAVTEKRETV